jgi:hypothetical protein
LPFQFVRIDKLYFSEDQRKMPDSTKVIITEINGPSYLLRDTSLSNDQKESIFYSPQFTLTRGKNYRIEIGSNSLFTKTASIFVFKKPSLTATPKRYLSRDGQYEYDFEMIAKKENAPIFLFTTYIEYDLKGNDMYFRYRQEIPISLYYKVDIDASLKSEYPIYHWGLDTVAWIFPQLSPYDTVYYKTTMDYLVLRYDGNLIRYALKEINLLFGDYVARVKRGIAVLYMIDKALYENYLANKSDRYSVRLDAPYYVTNFSSSNGNSLGYLGCVTVDTVGFKIYDELIQEYRLLNDQ